MSPVNGVMVSADAFGPEDLLAYVRRLESLGHREVWTPDMFGREIYVTAAFLLANTTTMRVASGIAHVYGRDAIATLQAGRTLAEFSGGRFIQGLGVSHPIAAEMRGVPWENPVDKLRTLLTAMRDDTIVHTPANPPKVPIHIAAHGPKMLAVVAELADGATIYMQPPSRMTGAREILGPDKDLTVVLPCCLSTDAAAARTSARRAISIYLPLPAYHRQWRRSGFDESDWADGGSDRLVDAHVAWGSIEQVRSRMAEYLDAGATRILMAPMAPAGGSNPPWDLIEAFAPAP